MAEIKTNVTVQDPVEVAKLDEWHLWQVHGRQWLSSGRFGTEEQAYAEAQRIGARTAVVHVELPEIR